MPKNPKTPNPKLKNNHHIYFTQLHSPSHSHPSTFTNNQNFQNLLSNPHIHSYTHPSTQLTTIIHINPQTQIPTIITTFISPTTNPSTNYLTQISHSHPNIHYPN